MNLVGMDDDEIAGAAVGPGAAIAERLQPGERDPDRIGVVAMRVEGMAGEIGLDALEAAGRRGDPHPVPRRHDARSFKTGPAASLHALGHELLD